MILVLSRRIFHCTGLMRRNRFLHKQLSLHHITHILNNISFQKSWLHNSHINWIFSKLLFGQLFLIMGGDRKCIFNWFTFKRLITTPFAKTIDHFNNIIVFSRIHHLFLQNDSFLFVNLSPMKIHYVLYCFSELWKFQLI